MIEAKKVKRIPLLQRRPRRYLRLMLSSIIAIFMLVSLFSGAYFNTFYNAQKYYKQALAAEKKRKGAGRGLFKKSLEKAVIVARKYPDSRWVDDAFFLIAMNYFWMENYEKALVQLEGYLQNFPESKYVEEAKFRHAQTLVELKRYSEGRVELQAIFLSKRYGKEARFIWAETYEKEKDWEQAKKGYEKYIVLYPRGDLTNAAQLSLAEMALNSGDTLRAIKTYEKYLKWVATSKENFERKITLANLYYLRNDYAAAQRTIKNITGVYSDIDIKCELLFAKIALSKGDTTKALKILSAIPSGENRGEAFYILGSVYEKSDSLEKAFAYFDTVSTYEQRSDYAALAERKKTLLLSRIQTDTTDTIQANPAKEQFLLAETYLLNLADARKALIEYERVIKKYPESDFAPKALYGIVFLKKYHLKDTSWLEDYKRLQERYPDSPAALEAMELLYNEEVSGDST